MAKKFSEKELLFDELNKTVLGKVGLDKKPSNTLFVPYVSIDPNFPAVSSFALSDSLTSFC